MNKKRVERRIARRARSLARRLSAGVVVAVVVAACALSSLLSVSVRAQEEESKPSPVEMENAELRKRVAALEERLEKLEAKERARPAERSSSDAPPSPASKPAPVERAETSTQAVRGQEGTKEGGLLNFLKTTEVSGFIDTYYSYNFNRPSTRENQARSFDTKQNQFALSVAEIAFEREPREGSRFGFRLDLNFGPAADFLSSAEPGDIEVYKHIQQAYGSYLAPVGRGLRFDVGKFGAWAGAEEDEAKDNWNYSRSLLYTFAQPAYHTGVQATYAFNDRVSLTGSIFNGWNNVEENNDGKSYGLLLSLTPTSKLTFEQTYIYGPEQPDDRRHKRHFYDANLFYDINRRFSLMGNYDYGFDQLTDGTKVRWQGVAAALRYSPAKRLAFSPRFEWYKDYDGFTTGTAQRLRELTLTGEYKLAGNLLTRLEYRRDWSNQPFFQKADPTLFARTQTTITSGFIWSFSTKDQNSTDEPSTQNPTAPETSAKLVPAEPSESLQASGADTNRPRRKSVAPVEQRASLAKEAVRANPPASPTSAAQPPASARNSSSNSSTSATPPRVFKVTDRLPPPAAKSARATRP